MYPSPSASLSFEMIAEALSKVGGGDRVEVEAERIDLKWASSDPPWT
jgi:hypothetical protein